MTSYDKFRILQLERENVIMRRRLNFLEKHVKPPAVYPATQEDMFAYMNIIWSVDKQPPVGPTSILKSAMSQEQQHARTYLQAAKIPNH